MLAAGYVAFWYSKLQLAHSVYALNVSHYDIITTMSERDFMYSITDITKSVAPIAQSFGIGKLALFGSYARNEASETSDLDFHIIDCGSLRGLFALAGFKNALEDVFKVPVDVVTTNSMYDDVRAAVEHEEIIVYG
jgi:predicted nucleotidyltransferase